MSSNHDISYCELQYLFFFYLFRFSDLPAAFHVLRIFCFINVIRDIIYIKYNYI